MKLNSKIHGEIEYNDSDIITFNNGILGFSELRKFIVSELEEFPPFKIFHSIEDEEVGMVVISPYDFFEDYKVKLSNELITSLNIKSEDDVVIINTVTLNSDPKKITTNLQGPIIINIKDKLGEQMIIDNGKYKIKEPLMKEE